VLFQSGVGFRLVVFLPDTFLVNFASVRKTGDEGVSHVLKRLFLKRVFTHKNVSIPLQEIRRGPTPRREALFDFFVGRGRNYDPSLHADLTT